MKNTDYLLQLTVTQLAQAIEELRLEMERQRRLETLRKYSQ
jgi:hypothetical protein